MELWRYAKNPVEILNICRAHGLEVNLFSNALTHPIMAEGYSILARQVCCSSITKELFYSILINKSAPQYSPFSPVPNSIHTKLV